VSNPFHSPYNISQPFGCTGYISEPSYGDCQHYHYGLDLVGPSPYCLIYPIMAGTVYAAGTDTDGANYVIVQSPGLFHAYWHLSEITCQRGQAVDTTTQIGNQGTSGNSTGCHLHLQLMQADRYGPGLNKTGTPIDPSPYLTDTQRGDFTDVEPYKIAKDLYEVLDPSYSPPDSVIQDKADAIASTDTLIPVLHDLLDAKPWRSPEDYNVAALEAYATAKGFPDPKQYAFDRVSGGDTFDTVITGDLSADKAHADQLTQLNQAATAQLTTFSQEIHDLQGQVATLSDENQSLHIALEKTEQPAPPADQTPASVETPSSPQPDPQPIETPQPATEPVPDHDPQPNPTPANDPIAEPKPQRMSYLTGLYYIISRLFLGR